MKKRLLKSAKKTSIQKRKSSTPKVQRVSKSLENPLLRRVGISGTFETQLTPEKRQAFLLGLGTHSNVTLACSDIGFSTVALYNLKKRDSEFAKAWDEAVKEGSRCLEDEAKRRAMGYEEAVYKNGEYVGKVKKYSDLLLLALLNAHWPEKYRPAKNDAPPPLNPDDAKRITEARDVLKRLNTDELSAIATVMEKATTRAVAQAVQPNGKRTLQ